MQTHAQVQKEALVMTAGVLDRIGSEGEGCTGTPHRQTTPSWGGGGETRGGSSPPFGTIWI